MPRRISLTDTLSRDIHGLSGGPWSNYGPVSGLGDVPHDYNAGQVFAPYTGQGPLGEGEPPPGPAVIGFNPIDWVSGKWYGMTTTQKILAVGSAYLLARKFFE